MNEEQRNKAMKGLIGDVRTDSYSNLCVHRYLARAENIRV